MRVWRTVRRSLGLAFLEASLYSGTMGLMALLILQSPKFEQPIPMMGIVGLVTAIFSVYFIWMFFDARYDWSLTVEEHQREG